jgi:hypothetical protein
MIKKLGLLIILFFSGFLNGQSTSYWQQRVEYSIDVNVSNDFTYDGNIELKYYNNSPDELNKVYFHLYLNAFQPGSEMDVRQRSLPDPDNRIGNNISKLSKRDIGFQKIANFYQDDKACAYSVDGTILEVKLAKPIKPGEHTKFKMNFFAQLPKQIRRSGKQNSEGVDFSMSQWYPKLAEYDKAGWHLDPYIAREFYGVYGSFDVRITIDKKYMIGGTGVLQNPDEVGHGYSTNYIENTSKSTLTWHFKADNVHDFAWAADDEFTHITKNLNSKTDIHFIYKKGSATRAKVWAELATKMMQAFEFMNANFGEYPYEQFTVIQGGDGGMEYPMCTFILGDGSNIRGKVGLAVHETLHSWYYGVIGSNEQDFHWMDEGFTSYAEVQTMKYLYPNNIYDQTGNYNSYKYAVDKGIEEAMITKADFFKTNYAYSVAAYSKGSLFLEQLSYIIGEQTLKKLLLDYYDKWKFRHPMPEDFMKMAEQHSGIKLDWFYNKWVCSTDVIDYSIDSYYEKEGKTIVILKRIGDVPMPLDIKIEYLNRNSKTVYIPLRMMRGSKNENNINKENVIGTWPWVYREMAFTIDSPASEIKSITIDASGRLADIDKSNNKLEF